MVINLIRSMKNVSLWLLYRGQPRKSVESYFLVTVDDINDNPPLFEQVRYIHVQRCQT